MNFRSTYLNLKWSTLAWSLIRVLHHCGDTGSWKYVFLGKKYNAINFITMDAFLCKNTSLYEALSPQNSRWLQFHFDLYDHMRQDTCSSEKIAFLTCLVDFLSNDLATLRFLLAIQRWALLESSVS